MLTTEQRISVVSWRLNELPFSEVQELFRRRCTEAPTGTTIRGLVNKFQRTGNVCDEKRSGRPSTSQETVNHTTDDEAESKSVDTSSQSGTQHPKVHCVANFALRTEEKAYQIHHLKPEDDATRTATCHDLNEAFQVHRGDMATLLGYGGQSCRTAVISLNYGVFFHIINISFDLYSQIIAHHKI